jgi:acetylornithine/succinyldiaminopimelate/putrescine aminotransferase
VEGAPFVQEALRQKLLINCTHDHILRLLPPFIVRRREVAEFLTKFASVLERGAKSATESSSRAPKAEVTRPMALAATR